MVELLIKNDANFSLLNNDGKTALDLAKSVNDLDIIHTLVTKKGSEEEKHSLLKAVCDLGKKRKSVDKEIFKEEKTAHVLTEVLEDNIGKKYKKGSKSTLREKQFKCDLCDNAYYYKVNLNRHKLKHTGEKPFKCDLCDYICRYKTNLGIHRLVHTGEKPFKCDQCEYASRQKSSLVRHKLTHSDEKPYKCDKCDFACTQKSNLARHKLKYIQEKLFKCDQCDFSCNRKDNLTRHKKKH